MPSGLRIDLPTYSSGLLTDDGSNVEEPLLRPQLCKRLEANERAMLTVDRLEEAQDSPDTLAQETIIDNMSTEEAKRLSKVRNIGIAVCVFMEALRLGLTVH